MQAITDWIQSWAGPWGPALVTPALVTIAVMVLAVLLGLGVHRVILAILRRAAARTRTPGDDLLLVHTARPGKWILVAIALALAQRLAPLPPFAMDLWRQSAGFVLPALVGWWAGGRSDLSMPSRPRLSYGQTSPCRTICRRAVGGPASGS